MQNVCHKAFVPGFGSPLGRQLFIDLYGCNRELLSDCARIREAMLEAARSSGATIVSDTFHKFNPFGISGVVVIAESHVAIHTWPEYGYAAIDVFTCGDRVDPWAVKITLETMFSATSADAVEHARGRFGNPMVRELSSDNK